MFGDWTTALAAYNCGEYRVQRVINAQRINYLDNFWDLFAMLPYETARFVPRFIAALSIIKNPAKYGFILPRPYPPLKFETTMIQQPVKLSSLSAALGLDPSELAFLNPDLRYDATPDYAYELRIPPGLADRAREVLIGLPRWIPPEATTTIYIVRRGDTLSSIARRNRTSVAALKRLNNIRGTLIRPGQRLKVPARGAGTNASAEE
jgi:membrane-bound lytic murein transglycosylase D